MDACCIRPGSNVFVLTGSQLVERCVLQEVSEEKGGCRRKGGCKFPRPSSRHAARGG